MIPHNFDINHTKLQTNDLKQLKDSVTHHNTTKTKFGVEDATLRKISDEFEALLTHQILKASFDSTNIAGKSPGSDIIKGMYTQGLADSTGGGWGISDILYQFLSENRHDK